MAEEAENSMTEEPTHVWVLIPAHRPALGQLMETIKVLGMFREQIVIVANGQHPITDLETHTPVIHDRTPDINISRWWNLGLDQIEKWETRRDGTVNKHHVLVLNADARIGPSGVAKLSHTLDRFPEAVMAGPMRGAGIVKNTVPGPVPYGEHVPGWCFMLTSRHPIRMDERFRWWCGDNDLEWRARAVGGTLLVGPIEFRHLGDGNPKGHLRVLAQEDLLRFEAKWSTRPW